MEQVVPIKGRDKAEQEGSTYSPAEKARLLLPTWSPRFSWEVRETQGPGMTAAPTQWAATNLQATLGGWELGFGAIETWAHVLAPLWASVASAVLSSWDDAVLTPWAQVRLEWIDVHKGTQYSAWHLRMDALLLSPSISSSGHFLRLLATEHQYNVFPGWGYFPLSRVPRPQEKSQKLTLPSPL